LYYSNFVKVDLPSVDDWADVLDLSTQWDFKDVRPVAINNLSEIALPIDKIRLARYHGLEEWLLEAYIVICRRSEALSIEEARRIPLEDVVKIGIIRQSIRERSLQSSLEVRTFVADALGHAISPTSGRCSPSNYPPSMSLPDTSMSDIEGQVLQCLSHLVGTDPNIQAQGNKMIVSTIKKIPKRGKMLRHIFRLITNKGIEIWSKDNTCASLYAKTFCDIADTLDPILEDHSFFTGRDIVTHHLSAICDEVADYESLDRAAISTFATRQAGFFAELYSQQLIDIKFVIGWWSYLEQKYLKNYIGKSYWENIYAFMTGVGDVIDVPKAVKAADDALGRMGTAKDYYQNSLPELRPQIKAGISEVSAADMLFDNVFNIGSSQCTATQLDNFVRRRII
jgi:hypothetical protein